MKKCSNTCLASVINVDGGGYVFSSHPNILSCLKSAIFFPSMFSLTQGKLGGYPSPPLREKTPNQGPLNGPSIIPHEKWQRAHWEVIMCALVRKLEPARGLRSWNWAKDI